MGQGGSVSLHSVIDVASLLRTEKKYSCGCVNSLLGLVIAQVHSSLSMLIYDLKVLLFIIIISRFGASEQLQCFYVPMLSFP